MAKYIVCTQKPLSALNLFVVCMQKLLSAFILLAGKRNQENDQPIHPDVLRMDRVHGIIGNSNWPRPSSDDIMLLIQVLPDKYCHSYDRLRHTLSNS